jgi:hypothetical protein
MASSQLARLASQLVVWSPAGGVSIQCGRRLPAGEWNLLDLEAASWTQPPTFTDGKPLANNL